jgi:5-methylcytosine-specific restriction protein A
MPRKPLHPCNHIGCNKLVDKAYCTEHTQRPIDYRGSARDRGYTTAWDKIRDIYRRANPLCARCGGVADLVHHVRPIAEGGSHEESNLQSLCVECHATIHAGK